MLRLDPVTAPALGGLQRDQRGDRVVFIGELIHADLTALPYAAPFPVERPLTEQVRHHGHAVEAGDVLRRMALFEIGLHGAQR